MEFRALAVSEGDAFLYKRDGKTALIDGGKNETQANDLLIGLGIQKIDYLICTHNDKDHAGGIIGILKESNIQIGELWIPDTWEQVSRRLDKLNEKTLLLELLEFVEKKPTKTSSKIEKTELSSSDSEERETFHSLSQKRSVATLNRALQLLESCRILYKFKDLKKKVKEILGSAKNIIYIYELAKDRVRKDQNFKIRLFRHQKISFLVAGHGAKDFLICVSANEISVKDIQEDIDIGYVLALTMQNSEALVFYSPERNGSPAVLFSSDSNLSTFATQYIGFPDKIIITAPHHGSNDNKPAFNRIMRHLTNSNRIWVRSDKVNPDRPACWYKNIEDLKFCTQCNDNNPITKVDLLLQNNLNTSNLRPCSCICYIRNNKSPRTTNKNF